MKKLMMLFATVMMISYFPSIIVAEELAITTFQKIHRVADGEITFLSGIYTYNKAMDTCDLLKKDYEGSLDGYRVQERDTLNVPDFSGQWCHTQGVRTDIKIAQLDDNRF